MGVIFWSGGIEILIALIFLVVIGVFVFAFVRGIRQWNKNNHAPRLKVPARVVSRRTDVQHHRHQSTADSGMHMTTSTDYYVTFQVASGDRMEFSVSGREYGLLAEGDFGNLSFQGTRYQGFERQR